MLADLTILLHEMSDALRGRGATRSPAAIAVDSPAARGFAIVVTGLGSPGKTRLVAALTRNFDGLDISVRVGPASPAPDVPVLRVHAETDLEALVEGGREADARRDADAADLVVPVDWEPVPRSVSRIAEALIARGADASRIGASA